MILAHNKTDNSQSFLQATELAKRFPALLSEARKISTNALHGAHGRRKRGNGETFWEFRHARAEDPASAIDWRRSAHSDALFVRETEWEASNTVYLWRDSSPEMNWRSQSYLPLKQDRAAVLLVALSLVLLRGSERCMVPGVSQKPGTGIGASERIAHEIITGTSTAKQLTQHSRQRQAHLVIASDFLEGEAVWKPRLDTIQQTGISVILLHISDPAEETFPFKGHTLFTSANGREKIDFGRAQLAQSAYVEQFFTARDQMRQLAHNNGWMFLQHRSDQNPAPVFLALAQSISNGHLS